EEAVGINNHLSSLVPEVFFISGDGGLPESISKKEIKNEKNVISRFVSTVQNEHGNIDTTELDIKISNIDETLNEFWSQGDIRFDMNYSEGKTGEIKNISLEVFDRSSGSVAESIKSRSAGLNRFLKILVEIEAAPDNSLILIDHPGVHLHPEQKKDMKRMLNSHKKENKKVIYSTHSPYMINETEPDSIRTIQRPDGEIKNDVLEANENEARAVSDALGISVGNELFSDDAVLVVEGPTEYYLIPAISEWFQENEKGGLAIDNHRILHHNGAGNVSKYAKWAAGESLNLKLLFDSDKEGIDQKERVEGNHPECEIYLTHGECEHEKEFEDLLPPGEYVECVNETYEDSENEVDEKYNRIEVSKQDSDTIIDGNKYDGHGLADVVSSQSDKYEELELSKASIAKTMASKIRQGEIDPTTDALLELFNKIKYNS
ncbi:MAG: ATP-dependent endonuclease, partial [Candidatus Paceibacteria bacterium]